MTENHARACTAMAASARTLADVNATGGIDRQLSSLPCQLAAVAARQLTREGSVSEIRTNFFDPTTARTCRVGNCASVPMTSTRVGATSR